MKHRTPTSQPANPPHPCMPLSPSARSYSSRRLSSSLERMTASHQLHQLLAMPFHCCALDVSAASGRTGGGGNTHLVDKRPPIIRHLNPPLHRRPADHLPPQPAAAPLVLCGARVRRHSGPPALANVPCTADGPVAGGQISPRAHGRPHARRIVLAGHDGRAVGAEPAAIHAGAALLCGREQGGREAAGLAETAVARVDLGDVGLVDAVLEPARQPASQSVSPGLKHQSDRRGRDTPGRPACRSANTPAPDPAHISGRPVIGASQSRRPGPRTACRCCSADSSSAASCGTRTGSRGIASRPSSGCRGRCGRASARERTGTGRSRAGPRGGDSGSAHGGEGLPERQWEPHTAAAERRGRQRGPFWRFRGI